MKFYLFPLRYFSNLWGIHNYNCAKLARSLISVFYSTNLFKRNDIIVYCNFLKTDRIFSWNTPKFSSCPVDAENGFKLENRINMKEDMYILVSKKSLIFSQFLPFKLYFPQIWNMNFFEKLFYSTITYEKPS